MKFKVLQGSFVNRQGDLKERYTRGQVFESNVPWHKRHPEKFALVDDSEAVSPTATGIPNLELAPTAPVNSTPDVRHPATPGGDRATYEAMSVDELKQFAAAEEIPLGKAKTKNEIIDVLIANV